MSDYYIVVISKSATSALLYSEEERTVLYLPGLDVA